MELTDDWRDYYREEHGINYGAKISGITADSPAEKSDLQVGDIILRVDGVKVRDNGHLINLVTQRMAGDDVELTIFRNGKEIKKTVTLAERPEKMIVATNDIEKYLGMKLETLTPEKAKEAGYPDSLTGVYVTDVNPAGPAAEKDIEPGDVISEMNDKSIRSVDDVEEILTSIIDEMKSEKDDDRPVLFKVNRAGSRSHPKFVAPYITMED
ncbi:PDZ domain-containing protein [bacterium]|nr:PDZ domain-containing protein [bacterium]